MRSYRNSSGVFQIDIYPGDNATEVANHVARNRSAGTSNTVTLLTMVARSNRNLIMELEADYAAYVADGSEMWFFEGGTRPRQIRSGTEYAQVIARLV